MTSCDFQGSFVLFPGILTVGVLSHHVKCLSTLRLLCSPQGETIFGCPGGHNEPIPEFQLFVPRD